MENRPLIACIAAALSLFAPVLRAAPEIATQLDLSPATTPAARKFYFETIPGQRYHLRRSTDLSTWQEVAGFPKVADGMALEHTFAQQDKEFFQIGPIDEQPPTIVSQYPAVDGFAIGRFADLNFQLADATGIDPASIRLTVAASGQLAPGAPGLTISGNTISYDSGDAALGAWGATVSATLVVADTLGHTLTHTWSFRLEPEPQVAANIFVFGSPTAQRAGQRVSGPAAALAARFPAPTGPVRASAQLPWQIDSVSADRVVIIYAAGGAPSFAAGQLICNLAPVKESEIFYRRVVSTSNDLANLRLTVTTVDVPLTEFISSGSASISPNSVIFDLDESGTLTAARAVPGTAFLDEISLNLSGSSFKLLENGYQTTVGGVTLRSGHGETLVDVEAEELYWKFYPQLRAGIELNNTFLPLSKFVQSADAVLTGRASCAVVLRATGRLAGNFSERPIINVPIGKVSFIGSIGTVPIYTSVTFNFAVKTKAAVQALIVSEMTYRQGFEASLGLEYRTATGFDWINSFQVDKPELGGHAALTGEFSLEVTIEPTATALVYGIAGFTASLEPSGKITTRASSTTTPPFVAVGGEIEASLDFVIKPAGVFFDVIYPVNKPMLSFPIWKDEWPLTIETLAMKTQPQSRIVAPGGNVTFSCTVDAPSAASFQWYHNNVLIPLQTSRSLFLNRVSSGHGGNYFVKVRAGNQSIDSETATLTVQAVTPTNLDNDNDGIPNLHETNTGTWVSITHRGTNPNRWDSDGDGLSDGVETNTGVFVSRSNTGTNPNRYDTDGDGINDKREIDLGTEPNPPSSANGFALIPAGSFQMGDQSDPLVGWSGELPVHSVYVSAFYMGKYEVTKELWDEVRAWGLDNGYTDLPVGNGTYVSKGANHPVHSINWWDMVKWCNARSQKENLTPCYTVSGLIYKTGNSEPDCNWNAGGYRLPTEAEWEKASRGGVSGKNFPWGTDTISHGQANYYASSYYSYDLSGAADSYHPAYATGASPYSSPVGSFAPNGYGVYDMAGNMGEWCWDRYEAYPATSQTDPRGSVSGSVRVLRGGCWCTVALACRVAVRYDFLIDPGSSSDGVGFRVARSSVP